MRRIQRHAAELLPRLFMIMAARFDVAGPAILHQVCFGALVCLDINSVLKCTEGL